MQISVLLDAHCVVHCYSFRPKHSDLLKVAQVQRDDVLGMTAVFHKWS